MATSPNFGWLEPDNTDLVKNGALAIRTAVDAIDTSMGDLLGGTTGQVLSKTSATDMDFTWITPSAGSSGAVVQVVGATTSTTVSTTSASYVDSGLTVTITPTSASNKVMLFVSSAFDFERAANSYSAAIRLYRSATGLTGDVINNQVNQGSGSETGGASQFNLIYLDSPATTSATTYKIQMRGSGGTQVRSQSNSTIGSIIAMEVTP
jgi:hypothetical protein